jgi:hypothetical protein
VYRCDIARAKTREEKETVVENEKDPKAPEGDKPEEDTEGHFYPQRPAIPGDEKEGFYPQRPAVPEDEKKDEGFYPQRP